MVRFLSKEALVNRNLARRIAEMEAQPASQKRDAILAELHAGKIPTRRLAEGVRVEDYIQPKRDSSNPNVIGEITNADFNAAWVDRRRYEVYAGRDMEPELWQPVYSAINDSTLPRNISVYRVGPGGVIFEEFHEGGETKFASVGSSDFVVPLKEYTVGLEYTRQLVKFNELWNVAIVERQAGQAYNAINNHLHFYPIINATYPAGRKVDGGSLTFDTNDTLATKYLRTIESAITTAKDLSSALPGPYVLLTSTAQQFTVERSLSRVAQEGVQQQSSAIDQVQTVIGYNGWSGTRGKKSVTYPGVTSGKAYLISVGMRDSDFQSFQKEGLTSIMGNPDVSRLIEAQTVWVFDRGIYADPTAVIEITWPTPGA